jgi:hypothetical protein
MESEKKSKQHLDAKDAMAAILGGCNGISTKHARRRVDWIMSSGTEEQRNALQEAMDEWDRRAPPSFGPADAETKIRVLRMVGHLMAKKHRQKGEKPPCDDPLARSKMLRIAGVIFSKKKVERVFVPLVADYITEMDEARAEGWLKIAVVKVVWWYRFAQACGLDVLFLWAGKLTKLL